MIRRDGRRIVVSGPVTLANVAQAARGRPPAPRRGRGHAVDLGEVTELDSALLALSLAWLRDAREAKRELAFANLPEALQTLVPPLWRGRPSALLKPA